ATHLLHGPEVKDRPNLTALEEFLVHGLKYVFPPQRGGPTRGIGFRAARQTKPSAPPSLLSKGLQTGWGRRFRLPGQCFTPSDAQRGDGFARTRPRADAWGNLDRQWDWFSSRFVGHRPIPTARIG